jgi:hypothetical protein
LLPSSHTCVSLAQASIAVRETPPANTAQIPNTSSRSHSTQHHGREPVPNWHCQRAYTHRTLFASMELTVVAAAQPAVCTSRRHASTEPNVAQAQDCCKARRCLHHNGMFSCPRLNTIGLTITGCWRVRSRKDDLHQHALLHHHQELCRPQATTPQADGQDGRD